MAFAAKALSTPRFFVAWILGANVLLAPIPLWAGNPLTWLQDDLPPAFITQGPDRGRGIVDGVVDLYVRALPEYRHRRRSANMARILSHMREGRRACYAGFLRTPEREAFIVFSRPNLLTVQNGIVVLKSRLEALFGAYGPVSLAGLLARPDLRLGFTQARSHGEEVDRLLAEGRRDDWVQRSGDHAQEGLLRMLAAQRIDGALGFPWEVPFVARGLEMSGRFVVLPIKETLESRWITNHVGCPRTDWGEKTIRRIDAVLADILPTRAHFYHQARWFPPEMEPELRAAYQEVILRGASFVDDAP